MVLLLKVSSCRMKRSWPIAVLSSESCNCMVILVCRLKDPEAGQFLLLEINPRVQGTIAAGLGAGINLPELAVKQELGLPISPAELDVKWGTQFSRYWKEVFY